MTDTRIATRCPGCFAAPGRIGPCPRCGYDERAERSGFLLPHLTLLHGQYLVGRVLGKPGGFGITYLGWDLSLETLVAIKEYLPREWAGRATDQTTVAPHSRDEGDLFQCGLDRFLTEARTLAQIDHPNVVRVRNYFPANGTAYLVMDYYPGSSLAEYLERHGGRLPEAQALQLILPILDGLTAVHAKGFLHRDIKPENLYLAEAGGGLRPILIDFGAARQGMGERTRTVIYTDVYAPIEQYLEKGKQGAWTDIYSIAAVLYRLVTGKLLPKSIARMAGDQLQPAADFGVSKPLSDALAAGLAIQPEDRPPTVAAFQARLAPPVPPPPRPGRPGWFWPAVAAPVLALAGLGGWYQYHAGTLEARVHQGVDDRHYESARAADTRAAYRGYLSACAADGCAHRVPVEQRLTELAESARLAEEARAAQRRKATDERAFAAARKADTADAYNAYLAGCADNGCTKRDEAQASLERIAKPIAPAMVRIPAGSFSMGCQSGEDECDDDEKPAHQVKVAAFELGKFEVTFDEWDACVADGGCTQKPRDRGWGRGKRPVINVSWDDAQEYLTWLGPKTGQTYRLPTEAEWEYAARAGTTTDFSTGNCINTDQANYDGNSEYADCGAKTGVYLKKTQPVGSYPANPWGLYDMHGNVEEWVQDCWHTSYTDAPRDGSAWLASCDDSGRRVVRGGSWLNYPGCLRSASRDRVGSGNRGDDLGFRVARTLTP